MNHPVLVKVCSLVRLQRSQRYLFEHQGLKILILSIGAELIAFDHECPHQGLPLDHAFVDLEKQTITCPYHHWCFQLSNGQALNNQSKLRRFPLEVKEGFVWVKLEPSSC